jgi:hypothetical protein
VAFLRSRTRRVCACALGALLCGAVLSLTAAAEASSAKEYELKAAYIYNFTKFTRWPQGSFAADTAPLVIGIVGNDDVARVLQRLVEGRTASGREVRVLVRTADEGAQGLHVIYIDSSQEPQLDKLAAALASPGLMTVGESERFMTLGGMVRFVVEGDRLAFEISTAATQRAGLSLSSQLLMLARIVHKEHTRPSF